jgi:hypothetical protein
MIDTLISKILETSIAGSIERAKRQETIIRILREAGLEEKPQSDFDSVYAHTLVEYGLGQIRPVLEFFRANFIRDTFYKAFTSDDFSILDKEAEGLFEWDWKDIGKELRKLDVDPRREFARFTAIFRTNVARSRTTVEIIQEIKLDQLLEAVKSADSLDDIRLGINRLEQLLIKMQMRDEEVTKAINFSPSTTEKRGQYGLLAFDLLKNLPTPVFDEILFKYRTMFNISSSYFHSGNIPQSQRATELVQIASQYEGEDVNQLVETIYLVAPYVKK